MATIFVTVGSTEFKGLVETMLSDDCLSTIAKSRLERPDHVPKMTIQYGSTPIADVLTSSDALLASVTKQQEDHLANKNLVQKIMYQRRDRDIHEEGTMKLDLPTAHELITKGASEEGIGTSSFADTEQEETKAVRLRLSTNAGPVDLELVDYLADLKPSLQGSDVIFTHAGMSKLVPLLRTQKLTAQTFTMNKRVRDDSRSPQTSKGEATDCCRGS